MNQRFDSGTFDVTVKYLWAVTLVLVCAACSTGMDAMVNTVQDAISGLKDSAAPRLNPDLRYLRVAIKGRVVFLALGNEDPHPLGPIEVWYSADREVLRLQNGRIAGATGLLTEWRSVVLNEAPSWSAAIDAKQALHWVLVRDVMPGYRFGVRDQLELHAILSPQNTSLQALDPQRLNWFEERVLPSAKDAANRPASDQNLPPARYAVELQGERAVVAYSEQCLAPDLCIAWQRWKP